MKTLLKIMILLSGLLAGQDSEVNQATKDVIRAVVRYEAFSPAKLQSAEAAVEEYRWRAEYEIKQHWNKVVTELKTKGENIPEFVDWLFSFGTLWETMKNTINEMKGDTEDEKKALFIAEKYEEMVISNNNIKNLIESFNGDAKFAIERNLSDLASTLSKNDNWGYEVAFGDQLKGKNENSVPKIEINWEELRSDIIKTQAIDLVGIDLTLFAGGFLTTVAVDAIYAYLWGQSLGYIGTISANLGLISAPTVFGTMGGPIGVGIGISLSIAGGWIYINYAEDKIVEKLQHNFSKIRTNLEDGDWVYRAETDYSWVPGILPVIDLTNTTAFNQYIDNVNKWNSGNVRLTPFRLESTKKELIKPMVVKSNINHNEGFYTFSVSDENNRDKYNDATEHFQPEIDDTEVVFYYHEDHLFTSDKSLIVMEDKLLVDWSGKDEFEFSNLSEDDLKVKDKTIKIGQRTIFKGTESATKELSALLKNIIELRTQ